MDAIHKDRRLTVREVCNMLWTGKSYVQRFLSDMLMTIVYTHIFSKISQRTFCIESCIIHLCFLNYAFFNVIFTYMYVQAH